jgi:hypothetical protein
VKSSTQLHWRYDLLDTPSSPAQYYAVALRGSGPDAEEVLVIAIECFMAKDNHGYRLVVSATITDGDGALLAEAECPAVKVPAPGYLQEHPERAMELAKSVQADFDYMVDWVNEQSDLIDRVLRQAVA